MGRNFPFDARLKEALELVAGLRGSKKDHAVRFGDLNKVDQKIEVANKSADTAQKNVSEVQKVVTGTGPTSIATQIAAVSAQANVAATQANTAEQKADSVTTELGALTNNFTGNLADNFADVRQDLLAVETQLSSKVSTTEIVRKTTGTGGVGGWISAGVSNDVPPHAPSGARSLRFSDGSSEGPTRPGNAINRVFRITGWFKAPQVFTFVVRGSNTGDASGNGIITGTNPAQGALAAWTYLSVELTVQSNTTHWAPGFDLVGPSQYLLAYDLQWEDITHGKGIRDEFDGKISEIKGLDSSALAGTTFGTLLSELNVAANGVVAGIANFGSAMADIWGRAQSAYLFRAKAGGQSSEFELVAWNNLTGGGSIIRMAADLIIAKGTMSIDRLVSGTGTNLLPNANFWQGTRNWYGTNGSGTVASQCRYELLPAGEGQAGRSFPTMILRQYGNSTDGYGIVKSVLEKLDGAWDNRLVPCKPGDWLYASAYISIYACTGELMVLFRDSNGTYLTQTITPIPNQIGSMTNPDEWPRYAVKAQVPSGAMFAQLYVRKRGPVHSSFAYSYLTLHKPMLEKTHADATAPSEWSPPGQTFIDGGSLFAQSIFGESLASDIIEGRHAKVETLEARHIKAAGLTRTGRAVYSGLPLSGGGSTWRTWASFTLSDVPLASIVTGSINFRVDDRRSSGHISGPIGGGNVESNAPLSGAGAGVRLLINGNIKVYLENGWESWPFNSSSSTGFHIRNFAVENIPAGNISVELQYRGSDEIDFGYATVIATATLR